MTSIESKSAERQPPRRRWVLIGIGVAALAALVAWWIVASGQPGSSVASPSTSANPGGSSPTTPQTSDPAATPAASTVAAPDPSASAEPTPGPRETLPAVPLDESIDATSELRVELVSIESVTGIANIAGEVSGPALRVTVEAANSGGVPFQTPAVVVNLYVGEERAPAGGILQPGSREFPAVIEPDSEASGVFLFTVPVELRDLVLVEVDLQVGQPVVLFEGPVE